MRADLAKLKYGNQKISNVSLTPGTVVAVRTVNGNFAKLRVVRYRESHDMAFKEAKYLSPQLRAFLLNQPNIMDYHLEVEWVLYRK